MRIKVWKFDLEDGSHEVDLRVNHHGSIETLFVDDVVVSRAIRWIWTLKTRHPFLLGNHRCEVTSSSWDDCFELRIDGQPVEMLPSQSLLRPALVRSANPAELLRPASESEDENSPEELQRPTLC